MVTVTAPKKETRPKHEYADKYVKGPDDVPDVEHWAIIGQTTYTTSGYDRGDPDSTNYACEYEAYLTKEKWENAIRYRMTDPSPYKKTFKAIHVLPAQINVTISVAIAQPPYTGIRGTAER